MRSAIGSRRNSFIDAFTSPAYPSAETQQEISPEICSSDRLLPSRTLTALQTRIDAYRLALPSPENARKAKSTHAELLKQEFARADMLVDKRLDGLIRGFEETNPQFVMDYRNARKITDTGAKPKPPTPPSP